LTENTYPNNAHKKAVEVAVQFHPLHERLKQPTPQMRTILKLMARNSQQVLGRDVSEKHKADLLLCWTEGGTLQGGTRQAIVIAQHYNIPTLNLDNKETLEDVENFLRSTGL
jgi:hypothetical protein